TDPVCGDAGMILHAHTGDKVRKGDLIMEIFGKDKDCLEPAKRLLEEAVTYSEKQPEKNPLIFKKI
ncbi:MAG: thymidine phosphorylase, partial [Treponema sp.]|nr:thymidine phosphorylase [Treponema sp.]